jgi:hypothetical protein
MKKTIAFFVSVLLLTHLSAQSTFCLSFANQTTTGSNFDVMLRMYSSDGNFQLGSSNFVFSYNTAALSNPVFLSSPLSGSVYDLATPSLVVTNPASGQVSLNIMYDGVNGGATTVPTGGLDMVGVRFTVVNNTLPASLTWLYDGGTTKTVVFDDDNATQIFRTSGEGCAPRLSAKAFIEGGYSTATGLMNDGLRVNGKIPLAQPYNQLTFTGVVNPMSAYTGTEVTTNTVLAVTGSDAIVDWVMLEVRNANDRSVVAARRAALLQRDGDIVDIDGVSPVRFPTLTTEGNYHIAVRHRLCLATRTQNALQFNTGGVTALNFTNNSNALTGTLKPVVVGPNTYHLMYVGDATRNGQITVGDVILIRSFNPTDVNLFNYFTRGTDVTFNAQITVGDVIITRANNPTSEAFLGQ